MKYILNNDNFEVVGKQYLNGVGNYNGTNPNSYNDIATVLPNLVEVTYEQLKDLRDNSRLVPGQQYRITDYVTTTSARNTRSAGNQFDIIVTALDKKTLSEEARAIKSETAPDSYFNDVNFSAWKIWYSLDNDINRFSWAGNEREEGIYVEKDGIVDTSDCFINRSFSLFDDGNKIYELNHYVRSLGKVIDDARDFNIYEDASESNELFSHWCYEKTNNGTFLTLYGRNIDGDLDDQYVDGGVNYELKYHYKGSTTIDENVYDLWMEVDGEGYVTNEPNGNYSVYILTEKIVTGTPKKVFVEEDVETYQFEPKGVIYRMIDEYNNECPYDFKNIQFLKFIDSNDNISSKPRGERYAYCYTFSYEDEIGMKDASVFCNGLVSEEKQGYYVRNNIINEFVVNETDGYYGLQILNNIVFYNSSNYAEEMFNGCYSNKFGVNCHDNNFGHCCNFNTFGDDCYGNILGKGCEHNVFESWCKNNTFGDDCTRNTFCINSRNNNLLNDCSYNIFGINCMSNILLKSSSNKFGNYCVDNIFVDECYRNIFGDHCRSNIFGVDCSNNVFKNECEYNTFGNTCSTNIFGVGCCWNIFNGGCENILGNSCENNIFDNGCYSNILGDYCSDNKLLSNCEGNTLGYSCSDNVFGDNSLNNILYNYVCGVNLESESYSKKYGDNSVVYAVCTSNAYDKTKEITITNRLYDGLKILINFINGNTYVQSNLILTDDSFSRVKVSNYEGEQYCYLYFNGTKNAIKRPEFPSTTPNEYCVTYTTTPLFGSGVYEFVYKEEDGGLHFTGSHTAEKDPYIYISNTPNVIQYETIIYLPKTIHTVIGYTIGDSGESDGSGMSPVFTLKGDVTGDYSFEFKTGSDDIEFTTPSWKWANGIIPKLKADKTYHVSVKNGCAVIAEF